MARAAVRAKQAQAAQAQAAVKPSRKQRKHASGGNPNQDLFFMRLRRKQKWVFAMLAVVFGISFVILGVGSGNGSGLESLYNSILGSGGDPVAQAKAEIKTNPAKGYMDLANAYVAKNDLTDASLAMQLYLKVKKHDSNAWAQLGGYQKQLGDTAAGEYQQVQQSGQLNSPGSIFQPGGALAGQLGSNPIQDYYAQQNQNVTQPLLSQAITNYKSSLAAYQSAAKYAPRATRAALLLTVYSAAQLAADTHAGLTALKRYVQLAPNSPNLKQIEKACTQLGGSCMPSGKK
jgi:tetratricopeptide (TPR) repeat protein